MAKNEIQVKMNKSKSIAFIDVFEITDKFHAFHIYHTWKFTKNLENELNRLKVKYNTEIIYSNIIYNI